MGQKVHPIGFRLGITKNWKSRWFSPKNYPDLIQEDRRIREIVKKQLSAAGIADIEVERKSNQVEVTIQTAKPGMVVGRGGKNIEELRQKLFQELNKKVQMNVQEVKSVETNAQLIAEAAAQQLEKRVAFRRVMKQSMTRAMNSGAQGIKIMIAGRLGGADIARTEWLREGRIPLHTLRADIDYGFFEAKTVFGIIGIKVWVYNGEKLREKESKKEVPSNANA
ncbi:MAG: 30S ribosomal protein S3 [Candidatus Sericytochromatia bacterium]|jgi:small subunit ribosomal protein S3|nr:30S ribosomal protein S3 [Candidatus Sericytochromatia bacterium]